MAGLVIVVLLALLSIFADVLFDYNSTVIKVDIPNQLLSPSLEHPFGTDKQGRDILARGGSMLSSARTYIRDYSYRTLFPSLAIMITILAFNLLGDGLRDALDPRLK